MTFPIKAGAALGFIIMALVGWNLGDVRVEAPTAEATAPDLADRPVRRMRGAGSPGDAAAQRMAVILAGRDEGERMRATVQLASALPPSEFAAWMDGHWFSLREGAALTLFKKIIMERWKLEDPDGLLAWSMKNRSSEADQILASWAETDPQRMFDFFKQNPNNALELSALASLAKNNPDLALQRLLEMGKEGLSINDADNADGLLRQLAKQSPAALEAALDSLPASLRIAAQNLVIGEKLKTSFDSEFRKLCERPDGFEVLRKILRRGEDFGPTRLKIFDELANFPPTWRDALTKYPNGLIDKGNSAKWAKADLEGMGFTTAQAQIIRAKAISNLTFLQPKEALELLNTCDITENARKNLLGNLFMNIGDEPELTETLLGMLASDEERDSFRPSPKDDSDPSAVSRIEKPSEWLEQALSMGKDGPFYQLAYVLWKWDAEKIASLRQEFNSMPDESKRKIAQSIVGVRYSDVRALEPDAVRYLVENPVADSQTDDGNLAFTESSAIRLASEYVGKMARNDPAATSKWIQSLPAGDARLWAQKNLHSIWSTYDPKAADEWMTSLPAAERAKVKALGTDGKP